MFSERRENKLRRTRRRSFVRLNFGLVHSRRKKRSQSKSMLRTMETRRWNRFKNLSKRSKRRSRKRKKLSSLPRKFSRTTWITLWLKETLSGNKRRRTLCLLK